MDEEQTQMCSRLGANPDPPKPFQKVGIALDTLHLEPLNGLRHPSQGNSSGWFLWGGTDFSQDPDFFEPLHITHLTERCARALKYLALPPGWRFLIAKGQEDVWHEPKLLDVWNSMSGLIALEPSQPFCAVAALRGSAPVVR